jgi:hypothetical protein
MFVARVPAFTTFRNLNTRNYNWNSELVTLF